MFKSQLIGFTLLTIAIVFGVEADPIPAVCQDAVGMTNVNATLLAGQWHEEIRAPAANVSCVSINVEVVNNQTLKVVTKYAPSQNGLVREKLDSVTVNITELNAYSEVNVTSNKITTKYKLLGTDYSSYAVLCGYTRISTPSASFGLILTRKQSVNSTWLMELKANASHLLSTFNDSSAVNITQSKQCRDSAAISVPALATLAAALFTLLKLMY